MTWKSTAAAGVATLAATWLASYAPVGGPSQPRTSAPSTARTETAAAEIQREADRLHLRLSEVGAYRDPARNPFRFQPRPAPRAAAPAPTITVEEMPPETIAPPTLRLTLAGIAEEKTGDEVVRTAIIGTPDAVLLVKVGEAIGEAYKVTAIAPDAVELIRLDTGVVVRLELRP